jgi:hypothetical protein
MRRWLAVAILAVPVSLAAQGTTHSFVPDRFYNTFSFAHPPALRIKPGDRVVTKTIDAGGTDWNGRSVAQGPNPQTGPFSWRGRVGHARRSIEKIAPTRTMRTSLPALHAWTRRR